MFVKGQPIERVRSEENQRIFEKVLPRIQAGESCASLAREFNLSANTVRSWKHLHADKWIVRKAIENSRLRAVEALEADNDFNASQHPANGQQQHVNAGSTVETLANGENDSDSNELRGSIIQTDQLKTAIQRQAAKTTVFLGQSNSPVLRTLNSIASLTECAAKEFKTILKSVDMENKEKLKIGKVIKDLIESTGTLYCLPLGIQKVSAFEGAKSNAGAQHLHIHSHGGSSGCLVKGRKASAPAALPAPAEVIELDVNRTASAGEITAAQTTLVRDL